jgi:hypothetical protein
LVRTSYERDWDTKPEGKLEARIAEKERALMEMVECPKGYTALDAREDNKRTETILYRCHNPTAAEEVEHAHLLARLAGYRRTPEANARARISTLNHDALFRQLSAAEQSELDTLKGLYPELPPDPDNPLTRAAEAYEEALKRFDEKHGKSALGDCIPIRPPEPPLSPDEARDKLRALIETSRAAEEKAWET